jgi:hypothetical protein
VKDRALILTVVALAILVCVITSLNFDFYQDDAYISYRYVSNYLDGHGLVFNYGERIEGYTNFGWVLYLLLWGVLGVGYFVMSKLTGIFLGSAVVFVAYLLARVDLRDEAEWFVLIPAALVAFNLSLAYWAQAGLETAAFVFLAALALYLFVIRHWLLIAALTFAVLVRPEGAFLAGLFIVIEAILERRAPWFSVKCTLAALILSLPYVGFKLFYYGSILPNPFYAKTGFDVAQVQAGLEYAWRFMQHYPYVPLVIVITPLLWKRISQPVKAIWLFTLLYFLYVVLIGGDVLKVHRFFLPIIAPASVLTGILVYHLAILGHRAAQYAVLVLAGVALVLSVQLLPREFVYRYDTLEKALTHKMGFLAREMKRTDSSNFSVAASTIGVFGYELRGHRLIDMLGLTDSTIARHPEPPLPGMESTWKERAHNTSYLLSEAPNYIVFSTGMKPSAPAERALFVYPEFLRCYRGVSWHYVPPGSRFGGEIPAFHKEHEPKPPFAPAYPLEFVNDYNMGINAYNAGKFQESEDYFAKAARLGGDPPYVYLMFRMARTAFRLDKYDLGERLLNDAIELDSTISEAHADLYVYEYTIGNNEKAQAHRRWLEKLIPWQVARYDSIAVARARIWQQRQQQQSP